MGPGGRRDLLSSQRFLARGRVQTAVLALLAYVPLLVSKPGQVGADTKVYLYLDPGRLLNGAPSLWQPDTGFGTVTHQNIGYLWPSGPFYWLAELAHLPDWLAQRIWMGSLLFFAGLGVLFLLQTIGWRTGATLVSAVSYMLSPYVLDYVARISVILLPYVALPWMIALAARALRNGGWRYPAMFALVAFTAGGTNATSLILVGLGPVLFIVHEVLADPAVTVRRGLVTSARIGLLTLVTSLWWIAGLSLQGRYGLPVLAYTETYEVVSSASTAPEVLRGLGLWFFYGGDKIGPWIEPSTRYTETLWSLGLSFALPVIALVAAAVARFRHRAFFVALIGVGGLIAVGSHPYDSPSVLGTAFRSFTRTEAGLALRSTPRAVPLLVLATSVLLGALVVAVAQRWQRAEIPLTAVLLVALAANMTPLFAGEFIGEHLHYDDVPNYWENVAATLDSDGSDTRVLEVPGSDFAAYRWGNTVDPVTPGLMDRPYAARELVPSGTPPSAALLNALDLTFQQGTFDPDSLAPLARLTGVGDIVLRSDLAYERYRTPRPQVMYDYLERSPGLGRPVRFGETTPNIAGPEQPLVDEITLATTGLPDPPSVAIYPVRDAAPIVRAVTAERPLVMAGGADGVVEAAGADVLTDGQALVYSATYADDPDGLDQILDRGADLIVTDSNRRRATRWGTIRETVGVTERAGETPLVYDPTDSRLAVFPDETSNEQTVTVQRGATVTATAYGNPVTYTPEDRAALALDGSLETAWTVAAFSDPRGEAIVVEFDEPTTFSSIVLHQPVGENRWITEADVVVDGESSPVVLDDRSRTLAGQVVDVAATDASEMRIEIVATNRGDQEFFQPGDAPVGFSEIEVADVVVEEWIRPPIDLLAAPTNDLDHRLALLFSRERTNPAEKVRSDPESSLRRLVTLPSTRSYALRGEARLAASTDDETIDALLGIPGADVAEGLSVSTTGFLAGDPASRGRAALDATTDTAWQTPFGETEGSAITIRRGAPVPIGRLGLTFLADGRHSVPSALTVTVDGEALAPVPVDVDPYDATGLVTVDVDLGGRGATEVEIRIDAIEAVTTEDWYSGAEVALPVGLAEIDGLGAGLARPDEFDSGCRSDLLRIDGEPVAVRVRGTVDDVIARRELDLSACDAAPVTIDAGDAEIETTAGSETGIDIDGLLFSSERGGDALRADRHPELPPAPDVSVTRDGRTGFTVDIGPARSPYWLVLGQSHSDGWAASGLGEPQLVNGFANGWLVDQTTPRTVSLRWTPQRIVWTALALTAVALVVVVVLALRGQPLPLQRVLASEQPRLRSSRDEPRGYLRRGRIAVAAAGLGIFALVNLASWLPVALVIVCAFLLTLRGGRWTTVLPAGAAACLAAAAAYIGLRQLRNDFESDFVWPQRFEAVHVLGVIALILLVGEAVRSLLVDEDRPRD